MSSLDRLLMEHRAMRLMRFPDRDVPEDFIDRMGETEDTIASTPAATMGDAIVKAQLLAWYEEQDIAPLRDSPMGRLASALAQDLERLAGGGS
jgi:hypothetical protein